MKRTINRDTLFEILSFARPHDSECERRFCKEFIDKLPDVTRDAFGNRMVRIGTAPVLWSSHVDTVAVDGGYQMVDFDPTTGLASLRNGKGGMSLGADDGAGVWMMLAMIEQGVEGLYVFHRGEEKGCLGSRWIVKNTPELLKGIDAAIAFDRQGWDNIITHQSFGMTASDDFAYSLAAQLNRHSKLSYRPDDTGVFTDTNEYADLIAECSNLSVGYMANHGPNETLDVYHVEALLDAVCKLDLDALTIKRQPGEGGFGWGNWGDGLHGFNDGGGSDLDAMLEAIAAVPQAAAELLMSYGVTPDDLMDFAWDARDDSYDFDLAMARDGGDEEQEVCGVAA